MPEHQLADFVKNGTFTWTRRGYHYSEAPGVALLTSQALASEDPWIQVASVVEFAKIGDHSHVGILKKWFRVRSATALDRVCMLVTGDAGTEEHLEALVALMQDGDDNARLYACLAAADAGSLWLVLPMLEAWHHARTLGDHETIGFAIADLLEERNSLNDMGPIAEKAGAYDLDPSKFSEVRDPDKRALGAKVAIGTKGRSEAFDRLVREKFEGVRRRLGTDRVPVWGGKPYGVLSFARQFHALIRNSRTITSSWGIAIAMRRKFESATGIECSSFFRKDVFQPLGADAVLEDFLDRTPPDAYAEGTRYFFGHPIPDSQTPVGLR